ncbi:glycosyltransferase family 4 protein [Ferruginibacter sp. HRS2-29]|uniref:glycosyltransferase family 4 protein n=1 Tax=Ferruginibacter sp. HRS2-29 TaxID=2487334 RepID=UPI0020CDB1D9|nr:glycosyltransferase family 1 protein [Ferruginibacter sp. HRS2-29]
MKPKVIYFLSHPIQYFSPLLRKMDKELDLHVYYFSDASIRGNYDVGFGQKVKWDIPLLEGYEHSFLKNLSGRKSLSNRFFDVFNPSVISTLFRSPAKIVIVNGWSYSSTLMVIFFSVLFRKKVWLRAENPLNQELRKSGKVLKIKKVLLGYLLFPFVSRFLYIGSQSKEFFIYYGVNPKKLVYTPYAVDNDFFREEAKKFFDKGMIKKELGVDPQKKVVLFSGKYIEKKRPLDLVKAFAQLRRDDATLLMMGEGGLRKEMETYIAQNNIADVVLTGFVNQSEIVKYYAAADVFVMCSGMGETWGLSVNEAMNFSMPVIVSSTCGSAHDLVQQGVNGFVYDEGDIEELSKKLNQLLSDESLRISAGEASKKIVADFSIDKIVGELKIAAEN